MRDSASFGAASLGVLLIAGAVLGTGVARTAVDVSDGLTWLPDDPRGEVVQVNPASGRPEVRLQVSGGDAQLEITQKDGVLVVLDRRSGQITVIDLATLLASGRRQAPPGATSKVLVSEGRVYVVDRAAGTITNADPVTLVDVGKPWRAGLPLADVVVDDEGTVWAVDHDGHLHALEWSDDDQAFDEKSDDVVRGAGPATVLVPHSRGVTLFGLDGGVVRQVGTGQDVAGATSRLPREVLAAQSSPAGLVPASVPGQGIVVLVAGDRVVRVDVAALGCARPGRPVVFRDRVYVPCLGAGKVLVLDRSGSRAAQDIATPGGMDPQLVFDDGRLFISAPGAERGVIVDSDGSTRPVTIRSPELPVVNPDRPPMPEVPTPPRPSPRPEEPTRPGGRGDQPRPPGAPGPGTTTGPSQPGGGNRGAPGAPPGITAMLGSRSDTELTTTVSWGVPTENGGPITSYTVVVSGDFTGGSQTTQTTETSARLTVPCADSTFCDNGRLDITVTATNRAGRGTAGTGSWNVPPRQSQPTTQPPAPTTTNPTPTNPTTTNPAPTTTNPPAPPPPPDPPPPPSMPAAGAVIIGTVTAPNGQQDYTRLVALSPPGDWASHNGSCQLVNTTQGYSVAIACSATSAQIGVEEGSNRLVVRAHASDGSQSVDSAAKTVRGPREPTCGKYACFGTGKIVELSPVAKPIDFGQAGAGLGLLVIAVFLYTRRNES
ncbi:fibronectin type III domain-containing protein [Actinophytocola algeriensis]|uniref:Fibronectin type-III domain-containing protein n=1 Tax=Actinophytocola algeriensis TaxID=1768010 RepID=A0A7W7Q1L7_9PSEU|nr:fibronectin type III domain-containing protein [Actinophytocola algeriensis]MBB4905349.1 hypothetical protein [Actinophytocola algeriensis]MBE1472966.1 outer membrane biosynthesis protein TonB [Actinophytocola algeriensis]